MKVLLCIRKRPGIIVSRIVLLSLLRLKSALHIYAGRSVLELLGCLQKRTAGSWVTTLLFVTNFWVFIEDSVFWMEYIEAILSDVKLLSHGFDEAERDDADYEDDEM